jgi:hypothetical protein
MYSLPFINLHSVNIFFVLIRKISFTFAISSISFSSFFSLYVLIDCFVLNKSQKPTREKNLFDSIILAECFSESFWRQLIISLNRRYKDYQKLINKQLLIVLPCIKLFLIHRTTFENDFLLIMTERMDLFLQNYNFDEIKKDI